MHIRRTQRLLLATKSHFKEMIHFQERNQHDISKRKRAVNCVISTAAVHLFDSFSFEIAEAIDETQAVICDRHLPPAAGTQARIKQKIQNCWCYPLTQIPAGLMLQQEKAWWPMSYGANDGMNVFHPAHHYLPLSGDYHPSHLLTH